MPAPIRLLCVDDHRFIIEGLSARAKSEPDIEFVGTLASADELVSEVARLRPDVVLLDLDMPGCSPLDAMAESLRRAPATRFVVLTAYLRDVNLSAAIRLGAAGFFSKNDTPTAIFEGIRRAAEGGSAFGTDVTERMQSLKGAGTDAAVSTRLDQLSPRELEVLRLIGRGMSRAEIAKRLFRALKTVDAHHTSIMRKLDIHDRAELTRFAIREGLVEG